MVKVARVVVLIVVVAIVSMVVKVIAVLVSGESSKSGSIYSGCGSSNSVSGSKIEGSSSKW